MKPPEGTRVLTRLLLSGPRAYIAAGPGSGRQGGSRVLLMVSGLAQPPVPSPHPPTGDRTPLHFWGGAFCQVCCTLNLSQHSLLSDAYLVGSHRADHAAQFLVVLRLQVDGLALVVPAKTRTQTKISGQRKGQENKHPSDRNHHSRSLSNQARALESRQAARLPP